MTRWTVLLALFLLAATGAQAADPAAVEKVFERCKICHTLERGGRATLGPNLHRLFGRTAGMAEGFKASDALKNSGIVWDDDSLARFLRDPKGAVPGNRMAFPGVKDDAELAALLAYLKQAT